MFFLIIIIGLMFGLSYTDFVFADALVKIPFSADDIGLQTFQGVDPSTGARIDGATQVNNALFFVVDWFRQILGAIAITWIVWQGYVMLSSQGEEGDFDTAKKSILWGVVALIVSFLIEPFIRNVIYGGGDVLTAGEAILNAEVSTAAGILEIGGFMLWIKTLLGVLTVVMIIFTGIQSMMIADSEDESDKQKRNIKWVMIGVIIIIFNDILINSGIYGDPHINAETGKVEVGQNSFAVILEATGFIAYLLTFFAVIAVASIIYGGYLILTAAVSEDQVEKGKTIIINTGIGIIIAVISYTLVSTVIVLQS